MTPDGVPYSAPGTASDNSLPEDPPVDNTSDEHSLSSAEVRYARDIFQDTLDYGVITLTRDALASTGPARTVGNTINLDLAEFVSGTFNPTSSGRETLNYEMTHVWQYQHDTDLSRLQNLHRWHVGRSRTEREASRRKDGAPDAETPSGAGTPPEIGASGLE